MTIYEYYKNLKQRFDTLDSEIKKQTLTYKDEAASKIEHAILKQKLFRIVKATSEKIDPVTERAILLAVLPTDNIKEMDSYIERSAKRNLKNYLSGISEQKIPKEQIVPEQELEKMTVEQMRSRVKAIGGEELVESLTPKGLLTSCPSRIFDGQADALMSSYSNMMPLEAQQEIIDSMEFLASASDLDEKKVTTPKYAAEIEKLKNTVTENDLPQNENGERITVEEAKDLLDFVNGKLTVLDSRIDLDGERRIIESAQEKESTRRGQAFVNKTPELKNGMVYDTTHYVPKDRTSEETKIAVEKARETDFVFSEEYKKDFKFVLRRLDEINHVTKDTRGEQGSKEYGFAKLNSSSEKLDKAIANGAPASEILKLAQEYKKDYNDMKELVDFADKHFSKDPVIYSGNLDVARNASLPFEFRKNFRTVSHINSCFSALTFIKKNGLDIDEFVEHPKDVMIEYSQPGQKQDLNYFAKQPYSTKTVTEMVDGIPTEKTVQVPRTFGQMYRFMRSVELDTYVSDKAIDYAGSRAIDGIVKCCPDEKNRDQNFGALTTLGFTKELIASYASKARVGGNLLFYQNLMAMNDDERDYVKALPGELAFNPMTCEIESGKFDIFEHFSNIQVDFNEMGERVRNMLHDYYTDPTEMSASNEEFVVSLQLMTAKLLTVKAEEKNAPGFAELKKFAEDPYREINAWRAQWGLEPVSGREVPMQKEESAKLGKILVDFLDNPKFAKQLKTVEKRLKTDIKAKERAFAAALKTAENKETAKKEFIDTLKNDFKSGKITEYYYKTRTEQILSGSNAKAPSMFRIDDFPKLKDYTPNLTEEERDGLTKDDIEILYNRDKERAKQEKEIFLRRSELEAIGVTEPETRKLADAPASVMSDTVLVENETGFENVEIEKFYQNLENAVLEDKVPNAPTEEVRNPAVETEKKKETEAVAKV